MLPWIQTKQFVARPLAAACKAAGLVRPGAGCLLAGPVWWCGGVVERVKVGELLEIVELCPGLYTAVHCHTLQGRRRAAV